MSNMQRIALPSESYYLTATGAADQRLLNVYAEPQPAETGIPYILQGTPGMTLLADTGDGGPIRGMIQLRTAVGNTFYVSGGNCWLINTGAPSNVGTVDPVGDLTLATDGTNVIVCCNQRAFLYDGTSVTELTGTLPYVPQTVTWVEGYFVFTVPGSQIFFISNLNSATEFDPLDFATAQGSPGQILRCMESHLDLWLFSTDHVEIWYLSGASDFAFQRQVGGIIEYGTVSDMAPCNVDNSVFWVGHDRKVYRADGYSPRAISTPAVERWLLANTVSDTIGMQVSLGGHNSYVLVFPISGHTWAYDATNDKWYELSSDAGGNGRWRASCSLLTNYNMMVGDFESGKVFLLSESVYTEDGAPIFRLVQFPRVYSTGDRCVMNLLRFGFSGSGQTILLQWSKDDGNTFNSGRTAFTNSVRTFFTRLGSFRRIIVRVSGTFNAQFAMTDAEVDIDVGAS